MPSFQGIAGRDRLRMREKKKISILSIPLRLGIENSKKKKQKKIKKIKKHH